MRLIQFVVILLMAVTFHSCKKCQECTTDMYILYFNGGENNYTSTKEYCGSEYDYAPESGMYYESIPGGYQSTKITCVDK
jgi:predicted aldo/keto reductase-like oxidoreductase